MCHGSGDMTLECETTKDQNPPPTNAGVAVRGVLPHAIHADRALPHARRGGGGRQQVGRVRGKCALGQGAKGGVVDGEVGPVWVGGRVRGCQ